MRIMTMGALAAAVISMTACASSPASAESDSDRLRRIERTLSDLQAAVYRDGDGRPAGLTNQPLTGDATVRISQLEREIQVLTGRLEEISYELDQANAKIKSLQTAMAMGGPVGAAPGALGPGALGDGPVPLTASPGSGELVTNGEAIDGPINGGAGPLGQQPQADVSGVELPLNPEAAFAYASNFLLSGDYARAESAFKMYLEAFPQSARAPDARFRLGEIYLATDKNADAANAFITHIRTYPNDPRAAEAHLKLGTAFSRLNQPDEACNIFRTLKSKFPNAAPAVLQRADREMAAINCG